MATKSLELNVLFDEKQNQAIKELLLSNHWKEGMVPQLGMHLEGCF